MISRRLALRTTDYGLLTTDYELMRVNQALMFLDELGSDVPAAVVAGRRLVVTTIAIERPAVEELLQP